MIDVLELLNFKGKNKFQPIFSGASKKETKNKINRRFFRYILNFKEAKEKIYFFRLLRKREEKRKIMKIKEQQGRFLKKF